MAGSSENESDLDLERPNWDGCASDVTDLKVEVGRLRRELRTCQSELQKVQKQFDQCVRLQKSTESYNQDLRLQVEKLSAELHEWKKRERNRVEAETQTEGYGWMETDYSYYCDGYYQQTDVTTAHAQDALQFPKQCDTTTEALPVVSQQSEDGNVADAEVGDGGASLAELLKATAEQAVTQTGFVFDESSGLYYDHSTGFYYDSNSQLYYDANTGIYYCYDPESGKYQFHSRIELPTVQLPQTDENQEHINTWKSKRRSEKQSHLEIKDLSGISEKTQAREPKEQRGKGSRKETNVPKKKRHSRSQTHSSRPRSRTRASRSRSSRSGKTRESKTAKPKKCRSQDRDVSHSDKPKKKKLSDSHGDLISHSDDGNSRSEAEEGEITGSEGDKESSSSSSSSSSYLSASPAVSPAPNSPVRETAHFEEGWPPCVRVTVVRSPVLQTGTLFILTADAVATIGREKDMDHAIRIPEMGVSKSHAEVYFDPDHQGYMLVDQGSQNGTVLNGNRILQPKVRCDPCPLSHGDEVKLGETVLSFHIHSGSDTCNGCEPGQVRAHLSRQRPEDTSGCQLVKEDKEEKRQRELKLMKLKYGLKNSEYEDNAVLKGSKYKDRAESRRQTMGSEGTFYRDEAPSSVHVEISERNKGRQMLQKMGWKHGEGLGKEGDGITEPIELRGQRVQSGLGSGGTLSVDELSLGPTKKQQNWEQARERYRAQHSDQCSSKPALHWIRQQPAD